jgi:Fe-S oxidoreductase
MAYAAGLVYWWARIGSVIPGAANRLGEFFKGIAGVHQDRLFPALASRTFRDSFPLSREGYGRPKAGEERGPEGEGSVLLWLDTFTNFFQPEIAHAAVTVLEAAGHRVSIPRRVLCCGRPLYDFGMLDLARRQLRQVLTVLRPGIESGIPIVGLEPSCVAVFRDELINLFPEDALARRLSAQTFTLAEFLARGGFEPPGRKGKAIVHGHCHHHSVMGMDADRTILERMGLDFQILDSGCCGMAGAFGFERDHYEVSIACGERVLLPAVREAGPETLILADGFSCREQIAQVTGRRARHLVEALAEALRS